MRLKNDISCVASQNYGSYNKIEIWQNKSSKISFYDVQKPIRTRDVDVDNMVILKLFQTKNNSKYLIKYFDNVMKIISFKIT